MCAQQTAADMPSAGLNIAELADTAWCAVSATSIGSPGKNRKTRHNPRGSRRVKTPIRSATHDVSRMAGHHDAPILRRGHPPPTPRIPRLELDRYLRPDGRGTRASRRRGHETRY